MNARKKEARTQGRDGKSSQLLDNSAEVHKFFPTFIFFLLTDRILTSDSILFITFPGWNSAHLLKKNNNNYAECKLKSSCDNLTPGTKYHRK